METAVKIARKWGYKAKGIPQNEAIVLSVTENFHGRTVSKALNCETGPKIDTLSLVLRHLYVHGP